MTLNPFVDPEWRATQTQLTSGIQCAVYEVAGMAFAAVAAAYYAPKDWAYLPGIIAAVSALECWRNVRRLKRLSANLERQLDRLEASEDVI